VRTRVAARSVCFMVVWDAFGTTNKQLCGLWLDPQVEFWPLRA